MNWQLRFCDKVDSDPLKITGVDLGKRSVCSEEQLAVGLKMKQSLGYGSELVLVPEVGPLLPRVSEAVRLENGQQGASGWRGLAGHQGNGYCSERGSRR